MQVLAIGVKGAAIVSSDQVAGWVDNADKNIMRSFGSNSIAGYGKVDLQLINIFSFGFDAFIPKPFDINNLVKTINKLLNSK